jgi:hypothetical protein
VVVHLVLLMKPRQDSNQAHEQPFCSDRVRERLTRAQQLQHGGELLTERVVQDGGKGWPGGGTGTTCRRTNPAPEAAHSAAARLFSASTARSHGQAHPQTAHTSAWLVCSLSTLTASDDNASRLAGR